jgi:hypothetical protein
VCNQLARRGCRVADVGRPPFGGDRLPARSNDGSASTSRVATRTASAPPAPKSRVARGRSGPSFVFAVAQGLFGIAQSLFEIASALFGVAQFLFGVAQSLFEIAPARFAFVSGLFALVSAPFGSSPRGLGSSRRGLGSRPRWRHSDAARSNCSLNCSDTPPRCLHRSAAWRRCPADCLAFGVARLRSIPRRSRCSVFVRRSSPRGLASSLRWRGWRTSCHRSSPRLNRSIRRVECSVSRDTP